MEEEHYSKVMILEDLIEAQLLKAILDEKKIPYRIRSFHDAAYNGLFQMQKGLEQILAPAAYHLEIKAIYRDILEYGNQNQSEEMGYDPESSVE